MLIIKPVTHRLRAFGIPLAIKSYDATSALHSGTLEDVHATTTARLQLERRNAQLTDDPFDAAIARQDKQLLKQRRYEAIMVISGCDVTVALRAQEGGLMGDSTSPRPSCRTTTAQ